MTDLPSFLSEDPSDVSEAPVQPTSAPEPVQPAAVEAQPEPQPTPEPEPAPAPQPEAAVTPPPGFVPLSALLDERERRQAVERQREELQARVQPPPPPPDPFEQPEEFAAYQQQETERMVKVQTFNTSRMIAADKHGDETVAEAIAWASKRAEEDPGFRERSFNHHHPVEYAIQEMRRSKAMDLVGDDPDAFVRKRAAELGFVLPNPQPAPAAQAQPAAQPVTPQRPVAPRPSLASAPSAGSHAAPTPRDGESTFTAMFGS